jgi:hypothetical protein
MLEFVGETATELTRPLTKPQNGYQAETVAEGPIECHVVAACGTKLSRRYLAREFQAFSRASGGIEFKGYVR